MEKLIEKSKKIAKQLSFCMYFDSEPNSIGAVVIKLVRHNKKIYTLEVHSFWESSSHFDLIIKRLGKTIYLETDFF